MTALVPLPVAPLAAFVHELTAAEHATQRARAHDSLLRDDDHAHVSVVSSELRWTA